MQLLDASKLLSISNWLATLSHALDTGEAVQMNAHTYGSLKEQIAHLQRDFSLLGLEVSAISAAHLLEILAKAKLNSEAMFVLRNHDMSAAQRFCRDVVTRATDELKSKLIFFIRPDRKKFYEQNILLFGDEVRDKFPSAAFEIDEAGKCFALDRHTAAVFHLMRVMEISIRAVARCLSIPDPIKPSERNWGKILAGVGARSKPVSTTAWAVAADKEFFESVYASLDAVRVAWRNPTMHVENKYTDEEAEHIFAVVRGFMMKLASRCDENGEPKA